MMKRRNKTLLQAALTLLGPRFMLSNGQASNWGPYPDSYLDARTISLPMP